MRFREPLPEDCPPKGANEIRTPQHVYRLVRANPPECDDFDSLAAKRAATSDGVQVHDPQGGCHARGLSVYTKREDALRRRRQTRFRDYKLCKVLLHAGAGYIKPFGQRSHHTWWPLKDFNILAECDVEIP